jgi:hypothetical protein
MAGNLSRRSEVSLEDLIAETLRPKTVAERKTQQSLDFAGFVEHYYNIHERLPSLARLKTDFPDFTQKQIESELKIAAIKLDAKGYGLSQKEYLSPEQLAVANAILNLADKRSLSKKLADFGIGAAKYANWKKNPVFNAYLRERSETILGNSIPEIHLALVDAATSGDVQAMKFAYELTGRYSQHSQQAMNVQSMLISVIEAVQKHVSDPKIIQAIAAEIQESSGGVIKGELVDKPSGI